MWRVWIVVFPVIGLLVIFEGPEWWRWKRLDRQVRRRRRRW